MYDCPEYLIALLSYIRDEMQVLYWNKYQRNWDEYDDEGGLFDPFGNTGNTEGFNNGTFEVHAYDWGDIEENGKDPQPNFKCGDVEITWYKYFGRGMNINQAITPDKAVELFDKCMASLQAGWNNKLDNNQK